MFVPDATDRLSAAMEERAILGLPAKMGEKPPPPVSNRRSYRETMKMLRAARWTTAASSKLSKGGERQRRSRPPSFAQRRAALGDPPKVREVRAPDGVRTGPAQELQLKRQQELANCEHTVKALEYRHAITLIDEEEATELVATRQAAVDKIDGKLASLSEKEDDLDERLRENQQDIRATEPAASLALRLPPRLMHGRRRSEKNNGHRPDAGDAAGTPR